MAADGKTKDVEFSAMTIDDLRGYLVWMRYPELAELRQHVHPKLVDINDASMSDFQRTELAGLLAATGLTRLQNILNGIESLMDAEEQSRLIGTAESKTIEAGDHFRTASAIAAQLVMAQARIAAELLVADGKKVVEKAILNKRFADIDAVTHNKLISAAAASE